MAVPGGSGRRRLRAARSAGRPVRQRHLARQGQAQAVAVGAAGGEGLEEPGRATPGHARAVVLHRDHAQGTGGIHLGRARLRLPAAHGARRCPAGCRWRAPRARGRRRPWPARRRAATGARPGHRPRPGRCPAVPAARRAGPPGGARACRGCTRVSRLCTRPSSRSICVPMAASASAWRAGAPPGRCRPSAAWRRWGCGSRAPPMPSCGPGP